MIKQLLLKDEVCNDIFADNLFISLDQNSALKADYQKVLTLLKVYKDIDIMEYRHKELAELHSEDIYILKVNNEDIENHFFIRLIIVNKEKLMDVLVYTLGSNENIIEVNKKINYYKNIFFSSSSFNPSKAFLNYYNELIGIKVAFIIENHHFKLIYKTNEFLKLVGYEDWDFENKYQNYLDMILNEDTYNLILKSIKEKQCFPINLICDRNINKTISITATINIIQENGVKYHFIIIG